MNEKLVLLKKTESWQTAGIFEKQPPEMFYKNGILINFANFTGKHTYDGISFW